MSKKSQTTGIPKRRRRRAHDASAEQAIEAGAQGQSESSYKSRAEKEAELQKWVIRGVIGVAAILALLVAIAFGFEQLYIPNQVVAVVNGENITVQQFRQEFLLENNRLLLQLSQLQNAGFDFQQLAQQEPLQNLG